MVCHGMTLPERCTGDSHSAFRLQNILLNCRSHKWALDHGLPSVPEAYPDSERNWQPQPKRTEPGYPLWKGDELQHGQAGPWENNLQVVEYYLCSSSSSHYFPLPSYKVTLPGGPFLLLLAWDSSCERNITYYLYQLFSIGGTCTTGGTWGGIQWYERTPPPRSLSSGRETSNTMQQPVIRDLAWWTKLQHGHSIS